MDLSPEYPSSLSRRKSKRGSSDSFHEGIERKRARGSTHFSSTGLKDDDDAEEGESRSQDTKSPLLQALFSSGLSFQEKGFHSLSVDQASFLKRMTEELETSEDSEAIIKEAHEVFQASDEALERALQPTETDPLCTDARGDYQDSLMYLLLTLEPMQKGLFSWLLERLAELALEDIKKHQALIRLILNHLKYLNLYENGACLSQKYLEVLEVVPSQIQIEMITALPEVLDFKEHETVGTTLQELYSRSPELSPVILDALTNLSLSEEVIQDLRTSISKTVASTEPQNLSVVVKFILFTPGSNSKDLLETVLTLREQLDLSPPSSRLSQSRTPFTEVQVATLGVIRSSIMRNKKMGDAWIKAIDSIKVIKEHQPLDVMLIMLFMDIPNRQKSGATLFRNKIRSGLFTEELFIKTISDFPETMKKNLHIFLELTDPMISSRESSLNHAAEIIYVQIFVQLDKYCRQEIVAELTTKVSSNTSSRIVSLDILSNLAYNQTDILLEYAIFLSGIMDYMNTMSLDQVRRLMDILSLLAYQKPRVPSIIRDDVHIVITKQLSSVNPLTKRMGVIGAVVTIKNMSRNPSETEDVAEEELNTTSSLPEGSTNRRSLPSAILRQAKDLLVNVRVMTNKVGEFGGLFMDELASVMQTGDVDKRLGKWIAETVANDFQESFISDVLPGSKPDDDFLPYSLLWDLEAGFNASQLSSEEDHPASIALNLGPMVARSYNVSGETPKLQVTQAARFIPHFRLLKTCISIRHKGNLSEIDALLGCPSWFVDPSLLKKMETLSELERNVILSSFFYAINWYRELLNAFAPAEDTEYSVKVVSVLKIIVRLREQLRQALPFNPEFLPPSVLHSIDVSKWKPPVFSSNSSGATGKKPRGKGKKKKANLSESLISQTSQKGASQAMSSAEPSLNYDLEVSYAPFFRELDLDAFHILGYDTLAIEASPEDGLSLLNDIEELKNSSLRGRELLFLFKDIYSKLDHVLIAKAGPLKGFPGLGLNELKNAGFSNLDSLPKKSIAVFGVRIIEYVLANLEVISEYYGRLLKMSDCPQDDASLFDSNTPQLMLCSEFGLKILDKIFNWNGFGSKSNRALLKEGLSKLASRTKVELNPKSSPKELMAASISYVIKFGETAFCSVGFAAAIVKLLDTLKNMDIINEDEDYDRINAQTLELCETFLKKEWRDPHGKVDKSAGMKKNVEYILNKFLSNQESTELLEKYIEELESVAGPGGRSEIFPSFSSFTLQIHFRALFASLIIYAHSLTFGVRQNHEEALESWSALILLLYKLVMVVKVAPSRALITIVARQSRIFLSHFIKVGMPMIDKIFKSNKGEVVGTLKSLQRVTRFLQHVCSHSKLKKDINLSNYVPLLKKTLETFVYRVKVTLAVNNCPEAFLMGNLKNRDLKGEEIKEDESEGEEDSSLHSENEEEGPQDEELDEDDESESPSNEDLRKSLSIEV